MCVWNAFHFVHPIQDVLFFVTVFFSFLSFWRYSELDGVKVNPLTFEHIWCSACNINLLTSIRTKIDQSYRFALAQHFFRARIRNATESDWKGIDKSHKISCDCVVAVKGEYCQMYVTPHRSFWKQQVLPLKDKWKKKRRNCWNYKDLLPISPCIRVSNGEQSR